MHSPDDEVAYLCRGCEKIFKEEELRAKLAAASRFG